MFPAELWPDAKVLFDAHARIFLELYINSGSSSTQGPSPNTGKLLEVRQEENEWASSTSEVSIGYENSTWPITAQQTSPSCLLKPNLFVAVAS